MLASGADVKGPFLLGICLALAAASCGGGGTPQEQPGPGRQPPPGGGTAPATPTVLEVAGGQTVTAVDVFVAPATAGAPDAQVLGAAEFDARTASNTGAVVRRGGSWDVLVFGPGLSGDMQVRISGPADIEIRDVHGIESTMGTPGLEFTAVVAGNAALGARTVVLQNAAGAVTTFTGGLEVAP